MVFGLTSRGAKIIDEREAGEDRIFDVLSVGFTKRGAIGSAKREVEPLIPMRDIEIINVSVDKDLGYRTRYIVRISHNEDKY